MIGQGREIDIRGEVWSQNFHTGKFFFENWQWPSPFETWIKQGKQNMPKTNSKGNAGQRDDDENDEDDDDTDDDDNDGDTDSH